LRLAKSRGSGAPAEVTAALAAGIRTFELDLDHAGAAEAIRTIKAGGAAARAQGVRFEPKPKLSPEQRERILARLAAGETCRAIAADFRVHHATIARLVPRG
jgi:DNA-binding NarL/FixJ family response regulator